MAIATLLLDAVLALATAGLFAYVGAVVRRRPTSSADAQGALRAFATWWWGLATLTALGALRNLLAAGGVLDVGLHRGMTYLTLVPLAAALWGLVAYLVYVQTGSTRWRVPILVLHAAIGAYFVLLIAWLHPIGVAVGDWRVTMEYEQTLGGPLLAGTLIALLGPTLVSAALYFALFFRVRDPVARYRIGMVAGAILVWFGSSALATTLGWGEWYWWPLVSRAISMGGALVVLLAYRPPRAVRASLEARRARLSSDPRPPSTRLSPARPASPAER